MKMDPLWPETCWRTLKYLINVIVSTYYILCISWIIKCLVIIDARCRHEELRNYWPPDLRMLHFGEGRIHNETRQSLWTFTLLNMQSLRTTDKWYTHTHTHVHTRTLTHTRIHTQPNRCMKREMLQCCGIKQYTQTEKLQQIGLI